MTPDKTAVHSVHAQDLAADLVAATLLHLVPDLEDYTVFDALLEATVEPARRTVIIVAWHRARLRRELDARGLVLPDYALAAP